MDFGRDFTSPTRLQKSGHWLLTVLGHYTLYFITLLCLKIGCRCQAIQAPAISAMTRQFIATYLTTVDTYG